MNFGIYENVVFISLKDYIDTRFREQNSNDTDASDSNSSIVVSTTPPSDVNCLWVDINIGNGVLKRAKTNNNVDYQWIPLSAAMT